MTFPAGLPEKGTRLDLDGFRAAFSYAWSRLERSFLKVECWQEYTELDGNRSQDAFRQGDIKLARELLREEAEADRPLYEDIKRNGIDYSRVRLVRLPLTAYLRYELMAYEIRAAMGENIEVVVSEPGEDCFDFLLFDQECALVHDYGQGLVGLQSGGWLIRDPDVLASLERKALELRRGARPIREFMAALPAV